ncbi:MAG: hypothetical protein PUE81_10665 [Lachnospiraceae bacterium]|nr:hypothetical protein [Lachnospiraceae bacterium]MDD7334469.1 hypothetical protein [Lachnospiraceae bacterium]MDY3274653.1 hypothetical protein [Agathobacter sp.]MDY5101749.1 hypothetical protein [Agathobacter sp.]MDY5520871.1 hypothetical protein [Agathobacter sp.]
MGIIFTKNTMGRYIQEMILKEDFLGEVEGWLSTLDDDRMTALHRLIYEVELTDKDQLVDTLYEYGGCLTEKNYFGRKFFEQMVLQVRKLEVNQTSS